MDNFLFVHNLLKKVKLGIKLILRIKIELQFYNKN